jgi:type VI secretion system protein ImpH
MAEPDRAAAELVALLEEIERAPQEFDFFQALRRVECATADMPRLGESARAKDEPIRLGQEPSMAFAPRTLAGLARGDGRCPPRLDVLFFGLFGPNAPMPLHLTEYCRNRLRQNNDPTLARFADIFHHRLLSLFYRAWANAQPTVHLDRPESDRFAAYIGSLIGLGTPAMRNRDHVPDHAKFYFSGRLSSAARHPEGLQAMLADYFGVPVRVEEFVGRLTEIPESSRCVLGVHSATALLGTSSTIGDCVWDCQQTFRIILGPLGLAEYRRLLPGGEALPHVVDLLRNYLGDELLWEMQLILRREQAPAICLGESGHLGMAGWLEPESLTSDADDFIWNSQFEADVYRVESSAGKTLPRAASEDLQTAGEGVTSLRSAAPYHLETVEHV